MIDTLCRLLDAGVTQFHVVKECEDILLDHDYRKLDIGERWERSEEHTSELQSP